MILFAQFKFVLKEGASQLGGFGTIGSLFPGTWDWQAFWHTTALISDYIGLHECIAHSSIRWWSCDVFGLRNDFQAVSQRCNDGSCSDDWYLFAAWSFCLCKRE